MPGGVEQDKQNEECVKMILLCIGAKMYTIYGEPISLGWKFI